MSNGTDLDTGSRAVASSRPADACNGTGGFCFRDTTREYLEKGSADMGPWIVFGGAGDSMTFFATADTAIAASDDMRTILGGASVLVFVRSPVSVRVHQGPVPPPTKVRFPSLGAYRVEVSLQGQTDPAGLPYTLRVVPQRAGTSRLHSALSATGARARLAIDGGNSGFIAVIPLSIARELTPADFSNWGVWPTDYSVLLVADTLYGMCRLPCENLDSVVLKPGAFVRRKY